ATRSVYAAPPYRTDDPEPTEFGHFELYTFSNGTVVRGDTAGTLPGIELNYGLIPNGQLTIDTVAAFDSPSSGPMQFGYGDTPISFKYRFIQEDNKGWRPQVAVFPLVNLPTGDEDPAPRGGPRPSVSSDVVSKELWRLENRWWRRLLDQPRRHGGQEFLVLRFVAPAKGDRQAFFRWGNIPSNRQHD